MTRLHEANLCGRFPEQALDFLNLVIGDRIPWRPTELNACLEEIRAAAPALDIDPRWQRLRA